MSIFTLRFLACESRRILGGWNKSGKKRLLSQAMHIFVLYYFSVALTHLDDQENARHAYEQAAMLDR